MTSPQLAPARPRKYRNTPTDLDGIRFASKAEARRYAELKLLVRAGAITDLELQKRYALGAFDGSTLCTYVADFDYIDTSNGHHITEDVKSPATANNRTFRLKAKLFKAQYGRDIVIVRAR